MGEAALRSMSPQKSRADKVLERKRQDREALMEMLKEGDDALTEKGINWCAAPTLPEKSPSLLRCAWLPPCALARD